VVEGFGSGSVRADPIALAEEFVNLAWRHVCGAPKDDAAKYLKRFHTPACGWKAEAKMVNLIAW